MPETPYQSTPADRRRAGIIGIAYVLLAVALAVMLFKIWPPTPWPSDKDIEANPQIAKALADCECPPPSPTPTPQASPSSTVRAQVTPQPNGGGAPTNPTPTAGVTSTPTPTAPAKVIPPGAQTPSPTPTPSETQSKSPAAQALLINIPIKFLGTCFRTSFDERLILLVIVAGILGSFVHGATSLADFIGNNNFNKSWTWFYLLRPAIGMALALVFYFVIRGGFLTTSGGAKDINPYGIAALAGLVGMFSKQATDKLSEVFGTLFRAAEGEGDDKRSGSLKPDGKAITITAVAPKQGKAGDKVTISGQGFSSGAKVTFGGVDATITDSTQTSIVVTAPPHAAAKVDVVVTNQDKQQAVSEKGFEYLPEEAGGGGAAPTITSVSPPAGSSAGQELVTITGSGFSVQPPTSVTFGGATAEIQGKPTETMIIVKTPQHAAGTVDVTVTNPDGKQAVRAAGYTFN